MLTTDFCHVPGSKEVDGYNAAKGDVAVSALGAGAVRSCLLCKCGVLISYPPLSFPSDSVWDVSYPTTNQCPEEQYIVGGSPIIIDIGGSGYQLTSVANGVKFDLIGDGRRRQVAWTAQGTRNAFLALDWDGDGKIDSGFLLFNFG